MVLVLLVGAAFSREKPKQIVFPHNLSYDKIFETFEKKDEAV